MKPVKSTVLIALLPATLLTACGSDTTRVESETHTTTIGQELLDLDRAYARGLISKGEYEDTKEDILHRYER